MLKYKSPGTYTEEIPIFPPKIEPANTTVVFIGYTEKHDSESGENLLNIPTKINSILEFETLFGKAQLEENLEIIDNSDDDSEDILVQFNGNQSLHNLYYSLVSFFDNGGNSCKIVSVGVFKNIGEPLSATELLCGLDSLKNETDRLLICVPEDQNLPEEDFYLLQKKILEFCENFGGFAVLNVPKITEKHSQSIVENYREKTQSHHATLSFGAAYIPNLVTNQTYLFQEDLVIIKKNEGEFSLSTLKNSYEILYQKYLNYIVKFLVILPPTGTVSGAFIDSENKRGIWKAPANSKLQNIVKPIFNISNHDQDLLNVDSKYGKSINVIREFTGKGTLIWGARTLMGNDYEWRYIPVRRLANLLEKDIQKALEQFVFEPNDATTWMKIKAMIETYLYLNWKKGALYGAKPREAYFVNCGKNQTMSELDVSEGNLIVQIGIAPARPAEFIVLRITQKMLPRMHK